MLNGIGFVECGVRGMKKEKKKDVCVMMEFLKFFCFVYSCVGD